MKFSPLLLETAKNMSNTLTMILFYHCTPKKNMHFNCTPKFKKNMHFHNKTMNECHFSLLYEVNSIKQFEENMNIAKAFDNKEVCWRKKITSIFCSKEWV